MSNNEKRIGNFVGFVLLSKPEWDKEKFITDFSEEWEISIPKETEESEDENIIVAQIDDMTLAITFIPAPVPDGEAEHYAAANYMWQDAVEVTKSHTAQILVAVLGENTLIERAKLMTKAISTLLSQQNAVAVYTDGAVHEKSLYQNFAEMMKDDYLPIFNWVWFGLYHDEDKIGIYTYGMEKFGKNELEIYVNDMEVDLNEVRDFTSSIVDYLLENDITLNDGETIGFSVDEKLEITVSAGIALEGETIKIAYPQY